MKRILSLSSALALIALASNLDATVAATPVKPPEPAPDLVKYQTTTEEAGEANIINDLNQEVTAAVTVYNSAIVDAATQANKRISEARARAVDALQDLVSSGLGTKAPPAGPTPLPLPGPPLPTPPPDAAPTTPETSPPVEQPA